MIKVNELAAPIRGPVARMGFTLIEALVVVVILGTLAVIAIPMYQNYVKGSKEKSASALLEQFPILLETYRAENGSFPVNGTKSYQEDGNGAPTVQEISTVLTDFKPRSSTAVATSFHYTLTITGSGTPNELATFKAIGVKNKAGNNVGINATGTYQ